MNRATPNVYSHEAIGTDRHAFAADWRGEVELHVADLVEQELHRDGGFTRNPIDSSLSASRNT